MFNEDKAPVGKWTIMTAKDTLVAAPTFDSPQAVKDYIEEELDGDTIYFILRIEDVVMP